MALGACAGQQDDDSTTTGDDAEVTAAEGAILPLAGNAQHLLYVRLSSKPSKEMINALIAAAQRGVDARAVLPPSTGAAFDASWMNQQHLEASGVDVDVRSDHSLDDMLAVVDETALVPTRTGTKKTAGAELAKKFSSLLDATPTAADGALQRANTVTVHPMPDSGHDRIVALLSTAKTSIDLEIYQLQDRAVVSALIGATERHVKVRVMLEPKTVGSRNFTPVSKQLADGGVDVKETPPAFDSSRNVDHAKFIVIDGKEVVFGTGNLVRSGLGGTTERIYDNRDFWVEDTRTANVKAGVALFEADWNRRSTTGDAFDELVLTPDNAEGKISALVDGARHRLWVYNQELDDAALLEKLKDAKHRGVDVRVLLGYQPGFGGPPKNQKPIDDLTAVGVKAAFLRKHYLHGKAIVADDAVYVGSQNFSNGGLRNNRELGEIISDQAVVEKIAATFDDDAR